MRKASQILKDFLETIDTKYKGQNKRNFSSKRYICQHYAQSSDSEVWPACLMTTRLLVSMILPFPEKQSFPISTVGQQIDKIAASAMEILHEQIDRTA